VRLAANVPEVLLERAGLEHDGGRTETQGRQGPSQAQEYPLSPAHHPARAHQQHRGRLVTGAVPRHGTGTLTGERLGALARSTAL
jgi:hypothetical protein